MTKFCNTIDLRVEGIDRIPEVYEVKEDDYVLLQRQTIANNCAYYELAKTNNRVVYNYYNKGVMANCDPRYLALTAMIHDLQNENFAQQKEIEELNNKLKEQNNKIDDLEEASDALEEETDRLRGVQNQDFLTKRYEYLKDAFKFLIKECSCLLFESSKALNYSQNNIIESGDAPSIRFLDLIGVKYNTIDDNVGNVTYGLSFDSVGVSDLLLPSLKNPDSTISDPKDISNMIMGELLIPHLSTYKLTRNSSFVNPFDFGRFDYKSIVSKNLTIQNYGFTTLIGFKTAELFNALDTAVKTNLVCYTLDQNATDTYTNQYPYINYAITKLQSQTKRLEISVRMDVNSPAYVKNFDFNTTLFDDESLIVFMITFDLNVKRERPLMSDVTVYNSFTNTVDTKSINMNVLAKDAQKFSKDFSGLISNDKTRLIICGSNNHSGDPIRMTHFGIFDTLFAGQEVTDLLVNLYGA